MDQHQAYSLYIVATPIGNLDDITLRALDVLKRVDFILCEDTRRSIKLLNHFGIKKKLISFHQYNENVLAKEIVQRLAQGECAALISDAGTPLLSDPGFPLVAEMIANDLAFTVLPGANALLPALIFSGELSKEFHFAGFLPKKQTQRRKKLQDLLQFPCPVVLYVGAHEVKQVLALLMELDNQRTVCVCKELTKLHETVLRATPIEILDLLGEQDSKGEYVFVLSGAAICEETYTIDDVPSRFDALCRGGLSEKEAIKCIAKELGVAKNEVYSQIKCK